MTDAQDTLPSVNDNGTIRVVLLRIDGLTAAMGEVKAFLQSVDARLRQIELERVGAAAVLEAKITAAHTRLDGHEEKLKTHADDIRALLAGQQRIDTALTRYADGWRVLTWIGSAVGLAIIGLIIAVVTGQVKLLF